MNVTLGVILGNRGFFPDHLCDAGRRQILSTLEQLGIGVIILPVDVSKHGSVESSDDARKCAELFRSNAGKIDGVLVTLPNFR
jgi:L-fucose isomerase-like protein